MATLRNIALSLLHLAGITEITRTLQRITRDRTRVTGKMSIQRLRGRSRASAANHIRSAGSYRTGPALRRSTAFSCRRTSSSASFARSPRNTRTAKPSTRRTSK
jgi:hypothetical protein